MNYYKILSKTEQHHSMQYKTGLNTDILPFNPTGSCRSGGLYFTREYILDFLSMGPWIRKVTLPIDAQIYEDPDQLTKKWKADKIILGKRRKITGDIIRELIAEGAIVSPWSLESALRGDPEASVVEALLETGVDVNEGVFMQICQRFDLSTVKMAYKNCAHTFNGYVAAINSNRIDTVRWLLEQEPSFKSSTLDHQTYIDIIQNRRFDMLDLVFHFERITTHGWMQDYCKDLAVALEERGYRVTFINYGAMCIERD